MYIITTLQFTKSLLRRPFTSHQYYCGNPRFVKCVSHTVHFYTTERAVVKGSNAYSTQGVTVGSIFIIWLIIITRKQLDMTTSEVHGKSHVTNIDYTLVMCVSEENADAS